MLLQTKTAFEQCQRAFAELQIAQKQFREHFGQFRQDNLNGPDLNEIQRRWDIAYRRFSDAQTKLAELLYLTSDWLG